MSKKLIIPIIMLIALATLAQAGGTDQECNKSACLGATSVTGIGGIDYRNFGGTGTQDATTKVKNANNAGCFYFDPLSTSTNNATTCANVGNGDSSAVGYGWAANNTSGNFPPGNWTFQTNTTSSNASGTGRMGVVVYKNCSGSQKKLFGPIYNTTSNVLGQTTSLKINITTTQSTNFSVNNCSLKVEYWLNVTTKGSSTLGNVTFAVHDVNAWITWPTLDGTAPTTGATAYDNQSQAYTFNTWTDSTYVDVLLTCDDGLGSGCDKITYCNDTINNCTPTTVVSSSIRLSTAGTSYIRYRSNDTAGNLEAVKNQTIKIDTTAPTTTATAVKNNSASYTFNTWTNSTYVNVTLTCNDGSGSGCLLYLHYCNDTTNTCTPNTVYSLMIDPPPPVQISTQGTSYIRYNSTDSAGNTETTKSSTIEIDTTAPTTTATAVKNNSASYTFDTWTNSTYVNVTLTCNDSSGIGCGTTKYCNDTFDLCNPTTTYSSPVQISTAGTSYIRYKSNDTAGNNETTKSSTIKIDTTAPTTTASAGSYTFGTWTNSSPIQVILTCNDGGVSGCGTTKYCTDTLNTCTPSTIYNPLGTVSISTEGTSYIRYRSNDTAGNLEAVKNQTIKIDTTAPAYSLNSTNSTYAGTPVEHRLYWQDSASGLSGYVFRFCNGTWNGSTCSGYSCKQSGGGEIILNETNQGNVGDAYVTGGFSEIPTYNYGTTQQLNVYVSTTQKNDALFLLWDLSVIPSGATITEATMSLYMVTAPPKPPINIRAANTSLYTNDSDPKFPTMWVEGVENGATNSTPSELIWTNQPEIDTYQGEEQATPLEANVWLYFNVTEAAISSFAQENQNMSIEIISTGTSDSGAAEFASKEYDLLAGKRPQLTITYTTGETNPTGCCGCTNDTAVEMTGTGNWSNVTKVVNSSAGATIAWCVQALDMVNNWNITSCSNPFTYMTTAAAPPSGATVSSDQSNYTACGAVFYKIRFYDQNSKPVNSYFTLNIVDPTSSTVYSYGQLYPNNATGLYTSNLILNTSSLVGTWLLKVLESGGVTSGKNFYVGQSS